ncbi:MAG: hypothetical protein RL220_1137 [Bacteroidota bacterium]|jgi:hypothetical protein
MKLFAIICLFVINSAFVFGQSAEFSFKERILKLESVDEGVPMEFSFEFTNSGSEPLIITEYDVECTCTKVEYPTEPVLPGKGGTIKVKFDTAGKAGWQYRKIYLLANTKDQIEEIEFRVKINPVKH